MKIPLLNKKREADVRIGTIASFIRSVQKENGEIPWYEAGKTDPWDHVEAAMGLAVAGEIDAACRAYEWMKSVQLRDGSFYSSYENDIPSDKTRDANLSSYIAVGVFHFYMITKDRQFLKEMWPAVSSAIDFGLSLQAETGEVYWAVSPEGKVDKMALLTGSSSIFMSFKCAIAISYILGVMKPEWFERLVKLKQAIQHKPYLFNMTKSRFSMDWYYPVLSSALSGKLAHARIERYWRKFVEPDLGVRCVSDRPWITVAETSELILALSAMGQDMIAEILFSWVSQHTFEDGTFVCGFTFPDKTIWPIEKNTWTNAAVLIAMDALFGITPAGKIFDHNFWNQWALTIGCPLSC